jgi:hypothetical protein
MVQVCFLNGHLRQAKAENATLRHQNTLEREYFAKRVSQLQQALEMHSRLSAEAIQAKREIETSARDSFVASQAEAAAATRLRLHAQQIAVDLQVSLHMFCRKEKVCDVQGSTHRTCSLNVPLSAGAKQTGSRSNHSEAGKSRERSQGTKATE